MPKQPGTRSSSSTALRNVVVLGIVTVALLVVGAGQAFAYPYNWFNGYVAPNDDRIYTYHHVSLSQVLLNYGGVNPCVGITGSGTAHDGVVCGGSISTGYAITYNSIWSKPRIKNGDYTTNYMEASWG